MEFDLSKIKFSKNDLKRNIKIPKILTKELAEFVGIIIGDGHVGKHRSRSGNYSSVHYQIRIGGNIRDKKYYETYVNNLFSKIFNTQFSFFNSIHDNTIISRKESKAIYYFMIEIMKIPQRKDNVSIPNCIMTSCREIKSAFLRGLVDADFCLTIKSSKKYPVINGTSKSSVLIKQCSEILDELGIKNNIYHETNYYEKRKRAYTCHRIYINGHSRVRKFLEIVGFSNELKIRIYQEFLEKKSGSGKIRTPDL